MNKLHIFILTAFALPFISFSQKGPGGVGNSSTNSLWLKADQGTSTTVNNASVSSWQDRSGNGKIVAHEDVQKQPLFQTNNINGYPTLKFDKTVGKNHLLYGEADNLDGTNGVTIFSVVRKLNTNVEARSIISKRTNVNNEHSFMFFFYTANTLQIDYETTNDRFSTTKQFANNENLLVSTMFDGRLIPALRATIYEGNTLRSTGAETSATIGNNNSPVVIGATHKTDNRPFEGSIAEVISYRTALNLTQRTIVNNYLSAKYNIVIADLDLYKMDDAANGNFDHEVAGIGSMTPTDNHLVAQGSGILEVSNASDIDNKFLFWGHNNGIQQAINTTDVPATVQSRFDRVWRVSSNTKMGVATSVGTVSMQFDLTNLGNVNPADLRLLISNNGIFSTSTAIAGAVNVSGNLYRFNGVSLADADFFTLGTINIGVTPLPITLLDFTAEKVNQKVVLKWRTASEQNNDRFEIERTIDGDKWEAIQTIKGNGNSTTIISYDGMDTRPKNGTNYYRLKQTDYNGTSTLSAVRSVVFQAPAELTVYPNPAKEFITINRGENVTIHLINDLGQNVFANQEISQESTILDLSNLNSGVYFVRVQEDGDIITRKIIILKE